MFMIDQDACACACEFVNSSPRARWIISSGAYVINFRLAFYGSLCGHINNYITHSYELRQISNQFLHTVNVEQRRTKPLSSAESVPFVVREFTPTRIDAKKTTTTITNNVGRCRCCYLSHVLQCVPSERTCAYGMHVT
jgi:hypothetical protein